jgi:hypothetical protein
MVVTAMISRMIGTSVFSDGTEFSVTTVRPEVTRDNMGHATVDVTQNVYNRTWWEERVEAVSLAAASVWWEFTPGKQSTGSM